MLEQREFDGYWWLPSNPERRVAGRLTFSPDAIALDLLGTFDDEPLRYFNEATQVEYHEVIHGMSRDQKEVTLSDCSSVGPIISNSAILASFRANRLYLGAWYDDEADTTFDEVSMRFTDLNVWAATSGFESNLRFKGIEVEDGIAETIAGIDVTFTPPEPVPVALGDGAALRITFPWTWNGFQVGQTESHITQDAMIVIAFEQPASFERLQDYVYQLRNFVALGIGRPVQIVSLTGYHKPGSIQSLGSPAAPARTPNVHTVPVEILYRPTAIPAPPSKPLLPFDMLFSLRDVRPKLEERLRRWFACQRTLRPVFDGVFAAMFDPTPTAHDQVRRYMSALEGHHRRTSNATLVSSEEHQQRLGVVERALSAKQWAWVGPVIEHKNEPTLAARIEETLSACPLVSEQIVGRPKTWTGFAQKAVGARDFLAHLTERLERRAPKGLSIVELASQLRAVAEMTLLLEIGFTCEQVNDAMLRAGRYETIAAIKRHRKGRGKSG